VHVMAIADSDSYLKWAAGLLDALPEGWSGELAVVRTPIAPSPSQMRGAVQGTRNGMALPPVLSATALRRAVRRVRPDVVVAACTGPVVDVLVNDLLSGLAPRPVLVSGLPGVSVPATEQAWRYRAPVDLFVLHSHREVAEFREFSRELDDFFEQLDADGAKVSGNLTEALMAQDYQDLTGQVLRRVISLVQELEENLVKLVRIAGAPETAENRQAADKGNKDVIKGEGPRVPGQGDDAEFVGGQGDVDDLLSSLGF